MKNLKIAFVIGHHKFSKGAYSEYFKSTEYNFWMSYKKELELIGDVYRHNPLIPSYIVRQKIMAKKTKKYDIVIELHFNASNSEAEGVECLHWWKSMEGYIFSREFSHCYSKLAGSTNRGSKALKNLRTIKGTNIKADRGCGFVFYQKPLAVVIEPFFGDNKEDCSKFSFRIFKQSITHAIDKAFNFM